MWPDRVSNPGPLTYESCALPTALRGQAVDVSLDRKINIADSLSGSHIITDILCSKRKSKISGLVYTLCILKIHMSRKELFYPDNPFAEI